MGFRFLGFRHRLRSERPAGWTILVAPGHSKPPAGSSYTRQGCAGGVYISRWLIMHRLVGMGHRGGLTTQGAHEAGLNAVATTVSDVASLTSARAVAVDEGTGDEEEEGLRHEKGELSRLEHGAEPEEEALPVGSLRTFTQLKSERSMNLCRHGECPTDMRRRWWRFNVGRVLPS